MLYWVEGGYGSFARAIIQLGKYNQQVENGGHIQYYDNGYASGKTSGYFGDYDGDIDNHKRMVMILSEFAYFKKIVRFLKRFRIELDDEQYTEDMCCECSGHGTVEPDCDCEEHCDCEEEKCPECDNGYVENANENFGYVCNQYYLGTLDANYYDWNNEMVYSIEQLLRKVFDL